MDKIPTEVQNILPASLLEIPRSEDKLSVTVGEVGAEEVDTFGWDTVFAIPIKDVNKAVVDHKSSPKGFRYEDKDSGVTCSGSFGDWQICKGGDGEDIHMCLPVRDLRGTYYNVAGKKVAFGYEKLNAIIEIKLKYIPHQDQPTDPKVGTFHNLVVRDKSEAPKTDPVASLVTVEWESGAVEPEIAKYIIEGAITNWCNEHLGDFAHVFATVNLNRYIDKGEWAFCNPSYTSYAYIDGNTPDDSVLGVLCMTGGRVPGNNAQQISRFAIPKGSEAGFLISRERFLKDLILPTLPLQWTHASVNDFTISQDNRTISLKDGLSIQLPDVHHESRSFTPCLKRFALHISGELLRVDAYTETEISPGIVSWCQSTHWYTIGLGKSKQGQTLVYKEYQAPVICHGKHESPGIEILDWMLAALAVIATAVLGILTGGAAFFIGALIIGLLTGLAVATPEMIAVANTDTSPSIDLLAFNAIHPIVWCDSKDFKLNFASLNSSFQLGGNPGFV